MEKDEILILATKKIATKSVIFEKKDPVLSLCEELKVGRVTELEIELSKNDKERIFKHVYFENNLDLGFSPIISHLDSSSLLF